MFSYSSILAKEPEKKEEPKLPVPEPKIDPEEVKRKELRRRLREVKTIDRMILPKYNNNMYSRWNTVKWLTTPIDDDYYNYDYCYRLFQMFMKWINVNNLTIKLPEHILFAKFISLMYLMSDKTKATSPYALK